MSRPRIEGVSFENGMTCTGVAFTADNAPLDLAEITISGRYPSSGWVMNREVHEMVRVLRGAGKLALESGGVTGLVQGDVVNVPAGVPFAWSGEMTLLMACSPPFSLEQYERIKGDDDEI